jgi:hypothetical protein
MPNYRKVRISEGDYCRTTTMYCTALDFGFGPHYKPWCRHYGDTLEMGKDPVRWSKRCPKCIADDEVSDEDAT